MKFTVVSATYNEAPFVPWFLRHWRGLADRIVVYDDHSNDGTPELLHQAGVELRTWPGTDGIDETARLTWAHGLVEEFKGQCDWLAVVDFDELLFGPYKFYPELRPILEEELAKGTEVIQTQGFNMTGQLGLEGLPDPALPAQLWEYIQFGVWAPIYSKPIMVKPGTRIGWSRGRHCLEGCQPVLSLKPRLKLLHFRYLGPNYTAARNARNLARCGLTSGDKGAAWSCEPKRNSAKQEGTALWSVKAQRESFNVLEMPI
jgi:glycosyltransferase involved in cell wall biosynthesis